MELTSPESHRASNASTVDLGKFCDAQFNRFEYSCSPPAEFLMELMPYLRKDTKPEDIAPGSSQILDDSTLIHTGVGRILGRTNFLQDLQKKFEEAGIKSKLTLSNESDKKSNVQEEGQGYAATRYERSMPRGLSGLASRALPDKKILDTPDDSGFVDFSAIKNLYAGSLYDKMVRISYTGMV